MDNSLVKSAWKDKSLKQEPIRSGRRLPLPEALIPSEPQAEAQRACLRGLPGQHARNVVEPGVAKHTLEDTQDSGVQFITPAGPRGIGSQQGP